MTDDDDSLTLPCGTTIDEISAYLDADRMPRNPHIESCPDCLNALESLARVGQLSRDLLADDAARLPEPPPGWMQRILSSVYSELRSGRELPIRHPDPRVHITVSEGAVRSLLRSTGDLIDGLFIGRTRIVGDADVPGAPVEIELTATVAWDQRIPHVVDSLRSAVSLALNQHTDLNVVAVNVTVEDVHPVQNGGRS